VGLALGAILAFAPTLSFAFATARYAADVVPTLMILSAMGLWALHAARRSEGRTTWWVAVLAWSVGAASIVMSLLLAFTGYQLRFERLNYDLYTRILSLFPW
jgi:small-conductance mechanosensitive channel